MERYCIEGLGFVKGILFVLNGILYVLLRIIYPCMYCVQETVVEDEDPTDDYETPTSDELWYCCNLCWKDGVNVGLSCEVPAKDLSAPNPHDTNASNMSRAQTARDNFRTLAQAFDDQYFIDTEKYYANNYWKYAMHYYIIPPEGMEPRDTLV
jgi:hypothetical protein